MNKPKISVLMNCYNGEKYLREAIDSVYSQTLEDWEIIFIDNQSTDSSCNIAKSYDSKLKYYKTSSFMTLGEARKWGIEKCSGHFLCVLDVDNFYSPNFLYEMYHEIINLDNYIMVFCGWKIVTNDRQESKKKVIPKKKDGMILRDLLYECHFDPSGTIMDLELLRHSGLSFDPNIKASEEYCLYMQLAAKYKMKALNKALFSYRWDGNNLTLKHISLWGYERKYTLDLIVKNNPFILSDKRFNKAFKEAYARGVYYEARYDMYMSRRKNAIKKLSSISNVSWKYFILFLISVFSFSTWRRIHHEY